MTASVYSRERGVSIHCNYQDCECRYTTGLISIRNHRKAAAAHGWIRGLRKRSTGNPDTGTGKPANGRWDVCPVHASLELAEAAQGKLASEERIAKRDANRKVRDLKLKPVIT